MKLWAVLFFLFFFCDLLQNYTENLDIIFIIPLSISLRKIIIEDLKISIIVNIKIFKGGKKYWNTFESKLDLDSWYFLAHLSISRVWRDIYQWSMIQPWIHCSRRSWRPLRLSRSRWAFQEIARNLYASVLSVFELRLIKKKKKRKKTLDSSDVYRRPAYTTKYIHACRYITRQEFALPPSSSPFPNIGNLYSIVETSETWHLHPQGVPSIITAPTPYFCIS